MEAKKQYRVQVGEVIREYEEGTTLEVVAKDFQKDYAHQIVLACEDYKLLELRKKLDCDRKLRFITTADSVGNKTYKRSMCLLLVKAIHDVCGHDKKCKVRIHFSVSKG